MYNSIKSDELWGYGYTWLGNVNFESAGYVARYSLKKLKDSEYGDKVRLFLRMSRRPGIGNSHARRYLLEYYPRDEVIVNGVKCKPPRYYDSVEEAAAPSVLKRVKARRRAAALASEDNSGSPQVGN